MPDDMLYDAIKTTERVLKNVTDFELEGLVWKMFRYLSFVLLSPLKSGLDCAEKIKTEFDTRWSPHWHCIIGRNFGSFVTHETKKFVFFYWGDKAVMLFKAG